MYFSSGATCVQMALQTARIPRVKEAVTVLFHYGWMRYFCSRRLMF